MATTCVETRDLDRAADVCAEVYFPHRLTVRHDPRHFRMRLSASTVGPVSCGVLAYDDEVLIETGELGSGYQVNVPLDGILSTRIGSVELTATPGRAAVYRPDAAARLRGWTGGGRLVGLKIERAALERQLAAMLDAPEPRTIALAPELDLSSPGGRQWWSLARTVAGLGAEPDGIVANPLVLRPLTTSLLAGLLLVVDHPLRERLTARPPAAGSSAIARARDLVEDHPEHPWTPADLARRVGLSVRGLHDGFVRHVGRPPMAHVRGVRLSRARADLLGADPSVVGVGTTASRWGFTHLGRFAAAYRARYGESPSDTLRR
ncbi:AraC family transcriptional regulator [Actinomycetospora sp. CA-084318]|uniref:AraC family transcriptional regulator n=1 Tax=Actinomycetospora sp. CA-084318 TaxID=3239892 RepID=UPI003D99C70A